MTEVTDSPDDAATPPAAPPKESEPARWFGLRNPFAVGFYAVLGGLVALALGIAVTNIVTVIVYIAFALFVALGLDPVVRALERKNVSRVWSIVIVYFGFAIVLAGVLLLILPTVVEQIADIAARSSAAMIFVGRSGSNSISARVFGSVPLGLAQIAPVPTVIVP